MCSTYHTPMFSHRRVLFILGLRTIRSLNLKIEIYLHSPSKQTRAVIIVSIRILIMVRKTSSYVYNKAFFSIDHRHTKLPIIFYICYKMIFICNPKWAATSWIIPILNLSWNMHSSTQLPTNIFNYHFPKYTPRDQCL